MADLITRPDSRPSIETESLIVTKENMTQPDVSKYIYKSNC